MVIDISQIDVSLSFFIPEESWHLIAEKKCQLIPNIHEEWHQWPQCTEEYFGDMWSGNWLEIYWHSCHVIKD